MDKTRKLIVLGGSFNPPGIHHRQVVENLSMISDMVLIVPCGPRPDKESVDGSLIEHRRQMVWLNFADLNKVQFDFYDLDNRVYTPTYLLQERYQEQYPDYRIWHAVGSELIPDIHTWDEGEKIWNELNFVVMYRPGWDFKKSYMPPSSYLLVLDDIFGSGSKVRDYLAKDKPIDDLVTPSVCDYIKKNRLYV